MNPKTHRRLEPEQQSLLYRSIIRAALSMPYRVGSERPYNFAHYSDPDLAIDITVEMEEERPGYTR